jgi:hypothetical protein
MMRLFNFPHLLRKKSALGGLAGVRRVCAPIFALVCLLCLSWPALAQTATTTTLAIASGGSAVTTITSGSVVTLTATVVAGTTPVTPGLVTFCDATATYCEDIHIVGSAQLTTAGTATVKLRPGIGSHSYKAIFAGTVKDTASSSGSMTLAVTGIYPTVTTIASSGSAGNYTVTATVGGVAPGAPTGMVNFLDTTNGSSVLSTASLGTGTAGASFVNIENESLPGFEPYPWSIAIGDFNRDGIPDLAVGTFTEGTNGLIILLGNGDGTFTAVASRPNTGGSVVAIAVGDFNGDGIPDLAVAGEEPQAVLQILLGNGDGTFSSVSEKLATGSNPDSIAVGDFNEDGIQDLAVSNGNEADTSNSGGNNSVTILLGNGDGTFTASSSSPATGSSPSSIAAADFNRDGILDLAVSNYGSNSVTILLGNGDGTFSTASASPATDRGPSSIAVGDFNEDGKQDLAVSNVGSTGPTGSPSGSVTILLGNGDGTFSPASGSPITGNFSGSIAIGEFNGDGILDLVGATDLLLGNGDGTFTATPINPLGYDPSNLIAVGDFNGDGIQDVAGTNYDLGTVNILQTVDQTATTSQSIITLPVATGTHQVEASYSGDDINGASISATASLTAAMGTPIVNVTPFLNPATYGSSVTLTSTVLGSGFTPTGAVTFYDGSTLLGTDPLNSSGIATYATNALLAGSHSITADYAGNTDYSAAISPAVNLTVDEAAPTAILTASANPVVYGTQINFTATLTGGGARIPTGTVTFFDGSNLLGTGTLIGGSTSFATSALAVGSHSITATYGGDSNYTAVTSAALSETVTLPAPTITWATPAAITYGTPLSATQLDASSTVAGRFVYTPAAGTVLGAGTQTLSVTFTPTDTTDYSTTTITVMLTVNKATPTITWATPAAITYGTALSATQLDATASVPGTFVYNPAAGTTPAAGSDTISVTFTPTDSTNYAAATATVTLMVNYAVPVVTSMSPAIASAGGSAFPLSVNGLGFAPNSTVYWGATALTTQFGSATQLTAQVPAADIASAGITAVTVQTPAPGGGTSNSLQFEVDSSGGGTPPTFATMTASVAPGSTASYAVTLPVTASNVSVTCLNLPAGATCSYSSATGAVTITTSSTTPAGTYQVTVVFSETMPGAATAFILLPILLLPLAITRKKWTAGHTWLMACLALVLLTAGAVCVGCGGGGGGSSTPVNQTHQVTSSGAVSLTIQ